MAKLTKLTGQQEIFAREYVRLGVGARAYRKAYNVDPDTLQDTVYQEASRLLANPKIYARVQQLREKVASVTLNSLVKDLSQARELAMEIDQPSAATSASMGIAKITGHLKDDPAKAGDIHIHFDGAIKGLG